MPQPGVDFPSFIERIQGQEFEIPRLRRGMA